MEMFNWFELLCMMPDAMRVGEAIQILHIRYRPTEHKC